MDLNLASIARKMKNQTTAIGLVSLSQRLHACSITFLALSISLNCLLSMISKTTMMKNS